MKKLILLMLILVFLSGFSFSEESNPVLAVVVSYSGKTSVIRSNQTLTATRGMQLMANDDIQTSAQASLQMMFKNAVNINLKENTRIVLNNPNGENNNVFSLTQYVGTAITKVMQLVDGMRFEINTPTTVADVRGTEFTTMIADDGTTGVLVEQGTVSVLKKLNEQSAPAEGANNENENYNQNEESTVNINQGQFAEVTQEGNDVAVKTVDNVEQFRSTWRQRRLEFFNRNHERILKRMIFRIERARQLKTRAVRWLSDIEGRMKRVEPRVESAIQSGNRMALRRISKRIRFSVRTTHRVVRRMRLMFSKIRTAHYTMNSMKKRMPDSPALANPDFQRALTLSGELRKELRAELPEIRKKTRYILSKARRWRKMIIEQYENNSNDENENRGLRGRLRERRFR